MHNIINTIDKAIVDLHNLWTNARIKDIKTLATIGCREDKGSTLEETIRIFGKEYFMIAVTSWDLEDVEYPDGDFKDIVNFRIDEMQLFSGEDCEVEHEDLAEIIKNYLTE